MTTVYVCGECDEILVGNDQWFTLPMAERTPANRHVHVISPENGHVARPLRTNRRMGRCCCCNVPALGRTCRACADEHGAKLPPMVDGLAVCAQLARVMARKAAALAAVRTTPLTVSDARRRAIGAYE